MITEMFSKQDNDLVKVSNDLVEQSQTLHTHVVSIQLDVEVVEVGNGGKQHPHLSVGLVIQILPHENQGMSSTVLLNECADYIVLKYSHHVSGVGQQEVLCHMNWQKVEENPLVVQFDFLHAVSLLLGLNTHRPRERHVIKSRCHSSSFVAPPSGSSFKPLQCFSNITLFNITSLLLLWLLYVKMLLLFC